MTPRYAYVMSHRLPVHFLNRKSEKTIPGHQNCTPPFSNQGHKTDTKTEKRYKSSFNVIWPTTAQRCANLFGSLIGSNAHR